MISFCSSWHLFAKFFVSSPILLNAHFRLLCISNVTVGVVPFLGFLDGMLVFVFFAEFKTRSVISFVAWILPFLSLLFWSYFGKAFDQLHVSWWRGFAHLEYFISIALLIPLFLVVLLIFLDCEGNICSRWGNHHYCLTSESFKRRCIFSLNVGWYLYFPLFHFLVLLRYQCL